MKIYQLDAGSRRMADTEVVVLPIVGSFVNTDLTLCGFRDAIYMATNGLGADSAVSYASAYFGRIVKISKEIM